MSVQTSNGAIRADLEGQPRRRGQADYIERRCGIEARVQSLAAK